MFTMASLNACPLVNFVLAAFSRQWPTNGSSAQSAAPNASVKVRYYTQLYGMAPPQKLVFVMQSFFGGHDAGFAFVKGDRVELP